MKSVINQFSAFAFSGSRNSLECVEAMSHIIPLIPQNSTIIVGDCKGVDAAARKAFPRANVFFAACFGGILPRRSAAVVEACVEEKGLFCAFPSGRCPKGLVPNPKVHGCFKGFGTGTWSSIALAIGQRCATLVCVHPFDAPSWIVQRGEYLGDSFYFIRSQDVPTEIF